MKKALKKFWQFLGTDTFLFSLVILHAALGFLGVTFDKWDYGSLIFVFGWRLLVNNNPKSGNEMPVGKVAEG